MIVEALLAALVIGAVAVRPSQRSGPAASAPLPRRWGRPWARADELVVALGRCRLVGVGAETSLLVVGPTRTGKTRRVVLPNALRHRGTLVATSVKGDVLDARLLEQRRRLGAVVVVGLGAEVTHRWDPWEEVVDDASALAMAQRMLAALPERRVPSSEVRFWHELATPWLAAWLLWAARGVLLEAGELVDVGCEGAGELLAPLLGDAVSSGRQRDSLLVTLQGAIGAFRRRDRSDLPSLAVGSGLPRTLVVLGSLHEQARHAPWFTVLLDVVLEAASSHADEVLVILDEVANLAPVPRLAQVASVGLGLGVRLCTVAQDLAQLEWAFGNEAASLVANHRARVFLDPSLDPQSRAHLAALGLPASGPVLLGPRGPCRLALLRRT